MHVLRRKKFAATLFEPTFASTRLTLRAVPISTGVVGDGAMPAASAFIEMTAECSGTTPRNSQQHFAVLPADPLAVSFDEGSSCAADEIGHLEGRPAHLFVPLFVFQLQRVQRTGSRMEVTFGKMEVEQIHCVPSGSLDTARHSIGSINEAFLCGSELSRLAIGTEPVFFSKTRQSLSLLK